MTSDSVPLRPPMTRDAAGTLLGQTMGLVAVTAGLFAVGAYLGRNLAYQWGWLGLIAAFGCLIAMNFAAQRSEGLAVLLLFGFGVLMGVAVAPTLSYYASADPLPAPPPQPRHPDRPVARGLDLPRHPQRVPAAAVTLWRRQGLA
jgi:hypothetical protein